MVFSVRNGTARLTQAHGRRSVIKRMPRTMRIRNARWPLRALSLVTLAALLAAPACAPLCAAQNCGLANTQAAAAGHCHRSGTMPGEVPLLRGFRNCDSAELPAIVLSSSRLGGASSFESRLSAHADKFLAVDLEKSASEAPLSNLHFGGPHDFLSSSAPISTGVLRI
jgi:hypothetical protein